MQQYSPIISKKREILKLVLSDSYVKEKKLYFSIIKPFDKLFFSKGYNTWCGLLCDYWTQIPEELKEQLQNFCLEFGNTKLYTLFHENEKNKRITTKIAPKNN
jgi:hypothetical protein